MPPYAKPLPGMHRKACKMPPMDSNWLPRVREWVLKLRSHSPWPRRMAEPKLWPKTWTSGIRSIPRCSHFGCLLFVHNWR